MVALGGVPLGYPLIFVIAWVSNKCIGFRVQGTEPSGVLGRHAAHSKLPRALKLTNTHPFAAWLVVTEDATPDGIRIGRARGFQ